jgi:hypothetical protein
MLSAFAADTALVLARLSQLTGSSGNFAFRRQR